tara:strand:- start:718 stop:1617 length:900 start_codon:yes stop_codon:yes gene_type:complete
MFKNLILLFLLSTICFSAPYFNSEESFNYLLKQCEIGYRYPGSNGQLEFKNYLINFLNNNSDTVLVDSHRIKHPYIKNKEIDLYNIFAKYNLNAKRRILLMAHWDTREIADKDSDAKNHDEPIIGANDGASGVAVLMSLAEILYSNPLSNIGIDLLFVDGEDLGRHGDLDNFSVGTKLFCKSNKNYSPEFAICLDMVADKDPKFKIEYFSYIQAEEKVKEIWSLANSLGYTEFSYDLQAPIYDDHRAFFIETGIPAIDIIDFDYPYWHTLEDTPNKCSAYTLGIVGNVVVEYIYKEDSK